MPKGVYPHTHIKPKRYPPLMVAQVQRLYEAGHTQAEVAERLNVSQKVIWNLMRNHELPTRIRAKRDQVGPKNAYWRGGRYINQAGYALVRQPDHPRAPRNGYVLEHVLVAERKIGRHLRWHGAGHPESEIVHHLNGDKLDNRPENIAITTFQQHLDFHRDPATGRNGGGDAECR